MQAERMLLPEEYVTFQIALIGHEGLVVGSDRRVNDIVARIAGEKPVITYREQKKFRKNKRGDVTCFFAGAADCQKQAREILSVCDPETDEVEWEQSIEAAVSKTHRFHSDIFNEFLVIRQNVSDAVWLVVSDCQTEHRVTKIEDQKCTGTNAPAQFLALHLWQPALGIPELKKLAMLTLAYAARENPGSVGAPFDLLTLDKKQKFEWSLGQSVDFAEFDAKLRTAFDQTTNF
jgi:hypothetical protein